MQCPGQGSRLERRTIYTSGTREDNITKDDGLSRIRHMSGAMPGKSESLKGGSEYSEESYALSMPQIAWCYEPTSKTAESSRLMYLVLRRWNRANKIGFKVRNVLYMGRYLDEKELERCNCWIEAGGAANAQKMEHWEAVKLFERVILGKT